MVKRGAAFLFLLIWFLSVGCQHALHSESGLFDVALEKNPRLAVDGIWMWGGGNPYARVRTGRIYIAPLKVDRVKNKKNERFLPYLQERMHEDMTRSISTALKEANAHNHAFWKLTDKPERADIRIDTALVRFKPQKPGVRLVSMVATLFAPVPGMSRITTFSGAGDIAIEVAIRDCRDNKLLLAFRDSNRKQIRLFHAEAFARHGNAQVNLREWAEGMGRLIRVCAFDRLGYDSLKDKLRYRPMRDVLRSRM